MDTNNDSDEDHLTSYDIQLSIQESIEASKTEFYPERFVPLSDQNRKLVKAIKQGHILELQDYVKYNYALDEADEKGWFPLHEAVVQPIQQILEIVLDASYKTLWEFKTCDGGTPLTLAVKAGLVENVRTLLEKGVWPNTKNDKGETPLLIDFAVSNNDILCTEALLAAGADPNLDPLRSLLVAVRANNHEIVRLLLSHGADVNCYFMHVNDTRFPSAIQYALNDEAMLRLLLNNGYQVEMCFDCMHGDIFGNSFVWSEIEEEVLPGWTSSVIKDNPFCEFITVPWMKHLVGSVVRVLIDYMDHVPLCAKLKSALEVQREWPEIRQILENPCSLKHLCRLKIRRLMGLQRLCQPASMKKLSLPPTIQRYILFKEYDLYGQGLKLPFPHKQIEDNLNKEAVHETNKTAALRCEPLAASWAH
ncbi:ankyrin repeat and SOCS box protein 15 [Dugong dugon]